MVKCLIAEDKRGGSYVLLLPGDLPVAWSKIKEAQGPRLHLVAREELRDGYGIEAGVAGPFQEGRMKSSFINYVDVRTLQNPWVEVCGDNAWTGIEMSPPRFLEGVKRKFSTSILCDIVRNA